MSQETQRVVLFVGGSLMPFCRFRRALIERLVRQHGCQVICAYWGDREDGIFARFQMPGVRWVDLGGDHATPPGPGDLAPMRRLFRLIRQTRPGVVCCFNAKPIVLAPVIVRLALRLTGRRPRIVALMEGLGTALSFLLRPEGGAKRRIFRRLTRTVDRWVLLNPRDLALIQEVHPDRTDTLMLPGIGTDTALFHPAPDPLAHRRLIFVGRLVPEKGIGLFLDLARHLKRQGRDWRLAIAGIPSAHGGITAEDVRDWTDGGLIETCGPVGDMATFYRNASVLIFPSEYHEGLPAALMEAQASGLPCIVLDRPAIRGAIIDGETGFLLPGNDPAQWSDALERLSDPDTFTAFSRAARRHACAVYDQDRTNARLATALLGAGGPHPTAPSDG